MKIRRNLSILAGLSMIAASYATPSVMAFPKPSISPVSWQLRFDHSAPHRIVVEIPGEPTAKAYWYMTYTVTNNSDRDVSFLPTFDWVTKEGKVIHSDRSIPSVVFDKIKQATGNKLLENFVSIEGTLRQGEDQAKDGVAIWQEPEARLGNFSIFVGGLSGESTELKDDSGKTVMDGNGKPIILFKTLELDYKLSGDELYPGNDLMTKVGEQWVMR